MKKVLVFGTFDGIHDGHREMLKEAKSKGSYLVVAVAPDKIVSELKGDSPKNSAAARIKLIKDEHLADEVILGDETTSSWKILKKVKPDIVALGYDQHELRSSLEEFIEKMYLSVETEEGPPDSPNDEVQWRTGWKDNPKRPKIVILSPYKPETHHNEFMRS